MQQASSTPRRDPWWTSRGAAAGAFAAIILAALVCYCGPSWLLVSIHAVSDGAMLALWIAAALGLGGLVLSLIFPLRSRRPTSDSECANTLFGAVSAFALGAGVMSLVVLALGLLGWLNRGTAFGLLAIGWGCGAYSIRLRRGRFQKIGTKARLHHPAGWGWLWLLAAPPMGVAVAAAFAPPGVLWKDISNVGGAEAKWQSEPHGYDVVEYHLQVPREWYEAGRIAPLHHNVFSFFPFNVESHYLLAMHLCGGPWAGMYVAQFMHLTFMIAAVLATCAVAGRWTSPRGGVIAGVAMAAVPWTTLLAPIAYNEAGLLLWSALALGWTLSAAFGREADDARPGRLRHWILAGVMAGLACGAKLTAVPMVLLPLAGVGVFGSLLAPRRSLADDRFRLLIGALLLPVVGTLTFMPWLMRTRAWTGNPLFPEATVLLGQGHFNQVQVERWSRAHAAPAEQRSAIARLKAFGRETVADARFGYALTPLAIAGLWLQRRRPWAWMMASLLILMALFWIGFTHLQSRFYVLAIPPAAMLAAGLASTRRGAIVATALLAFMSIGVGASQVHARLYDTLYHRVGTGRLVEGLAVERLEDWLTQPVMQQIPPNETIGLVGDARIFWNQRPMRFIRYRTVFDVAADDGSTDLVDAWLGDDAKNVNWFVVEPEELARFAKTYWRTPRPQGEEARRTAAYVVHR